jgi:hypothetical protein
MLSDDVDADVRDAYLTRIVQPRRARFRACLEGARDKNLIAADADLAIAGSFLTGSWYALAVSSTPAPPDWATRTARLVWAACGGMVAAG